MRGYDDTVMLSLSCKVKNFPSRMSLPRVKSFTVQLQTDLDLFFNLVRTVCALTFQHASRALSWEPREDRQYINVTRLADEGPRNSYRLHRLWTETGRHRDENPYVHAALLKILNDGQVLGY